MHSNGGAWGARGCARYAAGSASSTSAPPDGTFLRAIRPPKLSMIFRAKGMPRPRAEGEVGEIWVQGPNVGRGYWNRDSEEVFGAEFADAAAGPAGPGHPAP